jgi:predicted GNAT family acetyltransferase
MKDRNRVITVRAASPAAGELIAECEGQRLGSLTYSRRDGSTLVIEHVFVVPEARGGRVGRVLVDAAVALAHAEDARIVSVCGYARMVLRRTPSAGAVRPGGPI